MREIANISEDKLNLIISWYRLSIGDEVAEPDIFFKFMASWVSLNSFYNFFCAQQTFNGGDKNKLSYFASNDQFAMQTHLDLLQNDDEYQSAVAVLEANGILDVSRNQRVHISDNTVFNEVILCVYTVRNNLFHGEKYVSNARDFEVVTASHTIVSKFLKNYFDA